MALIKISLWLMSRSEGVLFLTMYLPFCFIILWFYGAHAPSIVHNISPIKLSRQWTRRAFVEDQTYLSTTEIAPWTVRLLVRVFKDVTGTGFASTTRMFDGPGRKILM